MKSERRGSSVGQILPNETEQIFFGTARFNDQVLETVIADFKAYFRVYDACLRRRPEVPGLASTPAASTSLRSRLAESEGCTPQVPASS